MSSNGRYGQLLRVLELLRDLDRLGGADVYELAERHGVDVRTIRRDLAAIEEAGFPLESERRGRRKMWRLARRPARRPGPALDARHYLALRMLLGEARATRRSSTVFADAEDLAEAVERALGRAWRRRLEAIEGCFFDYSKYPWNAELRDVFWPLAEAIAERRVCRVRYRAARERPVERTFRVLPLRLFLHDGAPYLACHAYGPDRIYALNLYRVRDLEVLDERADPPEGFDMEAMARSAFGVFHDGPPTTYRLRFAPRAAAYVRERTWHPDEVREEHEDGSLTLAFRCAASPEVDAWVASWWDAVEVLEPASLRRRLARQGHWLVERYGDAEE